MSNLGTEKICDCLEENMHANEHKVTYADVIDIEGKPHPREVSLMVSEDFFLQERLDYILWLNQGNINREF